MLLIESTADEKPVPPRRQPPRRRRRRMVALIAVPAATVLLAAAGWVALHDDGTPREASAFTCQSAGSTSVIPNDGRSPLEACRQLWESGAMEPGVTTAPPLVACVFRGLTVSVIEGDGPAACAAAGMAVWAEGAEYEAVGAAVQAVNVSLHDRYLETGDGCATVADWRSGLAAQSATKGWTIEVEQIRPERRCYSPGSIDPTTHTIQLVGMDGNYSIGCDPRTGC